MDNLLSYCGLVDARISTSEKDLPVQWNGHIIHDCTFIKDIAALFHEQQCNQKKADLKTSVISIERSFF